MVRQSYPRFIRWALANRMTVILMAVIPFALCWWVLLPRLGTELIPQVHQGEFDVHITLPVGTPLESTNDMVKNIEQRILEDVEVARIASAVGVDKTAITSSDQGEHTGKVTVVLTDMANRATDRGALTEFIEDAVSLPGRIWGGIRGESVLAQREDALMGRLRGRLEDLPQVKSDFSRPALFSFKTPIEVEIRGYELNVLTELGREVERTLAGLPGLYDVRSSLQRGNPEPLRITRRRQSPEVRAAPSSAAPWWFALQQSPVHSETLPFMSCKPSGLGAKEPTGALRCPSHSLPQRRQLANASPGESPHQ